MIGDKAIVLDYKQTFGSPEGLRTLDDLNKFTKALMANKPVNNDALSMAYREGQRSVIIHIMSKVNRKLNEPKKVIS